MKQRRMTEADKGRVVERAKTGTSIEHIAARLGFNYNQTWRCVQRAEADGLLPSGTTARLGKGRPKTTAPAVPAAPLDARARVLADAGIRVSAPQPAAAAAMGSCDAKCADRAYVVLDVRGTQIKLCAQHAVDVQVSICEAVQQGAAKRRRFNSAFAPAH